MKFTCIIYLDGEPMRTIDALRKALLEQVVAGVADCESLLDAQQEFRVYDVEGAEVGNWQVSS